MTTNTINCQQDCVNGCVLGDRCPHLEYLKAAQKFIAEKSIDQMLEIAASRFEMPKSTSNSEELSL